MFDVEKLVRKNIKELTPYSSARSEYMSSAGVFLDANENPFGNMNRYPDPYQYALKEKISLLKAIPPENIFVGNGSDEIIDLVIRIFCTPGVDKVLTFKPTYGMYEVATAINDVALLEIPLNKDFQIDIASLDTIWNNEALKVIFICSPNNPTGNVIDNIEYIIERFRGIVVVDEAYIDFAQSGSWIQQITTYPNLIVIQTLSKAWGLAAARIGIAYAQQATINYLNKVKAPYNISRLNQEAAMQTLEDQAIFESNRAILLQQKAWLEEQLSALPAVIKVFASDANFLLVEMTDADRIYKNLLAQNIITRNRTHVVQNCIRITVGSSKENIQLIQALQQIQA
jgi:histidinol-phosphate aminotransferase